MTVFQQYNVYDGLTACRVVSTSNVSGTYNNGPSNNGVGATLTIAASSLTVDSVVVAVGDRVLLEAQSAANQNGIYVVASIGSTVVLQRSADMQNIEQIKKGQFVSIGAGTLNAGAMFCVVEPLPQQFGVSNFVWAASPLNSNLGTAATKAASDNSSPTLASVEGAPVVSGDLVSFSGTAGSIQDSGIASALLGTFTVSVSLSQAQVQGAYATPVQLIAAPGSGKAIMVLNAAVYTNFQTSAFAGGGVAIVQYANTAHGAGTNALSATVPAAEITAAASQIYALNENTGNALTGISNAGIFFSNQTGAFTGGSASSTVVVTLTYQVLTATV